MVELGLEPGFLIPSMVSVPDATVWPEESSFLFPSLISTRCSIQWPASSLPLLEISHRLPWEPVPWASGLLLPPPHDPHLGGLLAAPPGSFDTCGFQMSISSTRFVFLVPGADSMEEGWAWSPEGPGSYVGGCAMFRTHPAFPLAGWQLLFLVLEELGVGHRQGRTPLVWTGSRAVRRARRLEEALPW